MVGADVGAICREAATEAVREYVAAGEEADLADVELTMAHFEAAIESVEADEFESDAPDLGDFGAGPIGSES